MAKPSPQMLMDALHAAHRASFIVAELIDSSRKGDDFVSKTQIGAIRHDIIMLESLLNTLREESES